MSNLVNPFVNKAITNLMTMQTFFALFIVSFLLLGCERSDENYADQDWKPLSVPTRIDLTDVFFVTEDVGFVAGRGVDSVYTTVVWHQGDRASFGAWQQEPHTTNALPFYYEKNIDRIVPETPPASFFKTLDGGASWSAIATPFVTNVTDIYFVTPSYGFVTTSEEGVFKTTDGGESWQKILDPIVFLGKQFYMTNPYNRIYFVNEDLGFTFADFMSNEGRINKYYPVVIRTIDGGKSWEFLSGTDELPQLRFTNITFADDLTVGYANSDGRGYSTVDGGRTWQSIGIEVPENMIESPEVNKFGETFYDINGIGLWEANAGYLVANRGAQIYTIRDGAVMLLTSLNTNPITYPKIFSSRTDVYSPQEGIFYLIAIDQTIERRRGQVFITRDGGQSFIETSGIGDRIIYDWSFSGEVGYLVGPNGLLLKHQLAEYK